MVLSDDDYMKTLPYFLTHGVRSHELCFVVHQNELKTVVYIDDDDHFIQTIPQELWDAKVVGQHTGKIVLLECEDRGDVKRVGNIGVRYVDIVR